MMRFLPKKSKKGMTLVESVIAVVVLGMFAAGVLTLLTSGGIKIQKISSEASAYTEATQKLDAVLSAISNGSSTYIEEVEVAGEKTVTLKVDALKTALGFDSAAVDIDATIELFDNTLGATPSNVRGWYVKLTYNGVTVSGFTSNSKGVFDQ